MLVFLGIFQQENKPHGRLRMNSGLSAVPDSYRLFSVVKNPAKLGVYGEWRSEDPEKVALTFGYACEKLK
ncbi:hypothetical protein GCM10027190_54660 [Spirosoma areae]